MMKFREDLDELQCSCGRPACEDPVVFHSACHPNEPTWCLYFDGELKVICSKCEKLVISVAVARKGETRD